jgi:hypothetical protein
MVKSGVVSLVLLSVEDEPVSVPAVISGVPGAASAVLSIVTLSEPEGFDSFPTLLIWVAVITAHH